MHTLYVYSLSYYSYSAEMRDFVRRPVWFFERTSSNQCLSNQSIKENKSLQVYKTFVVVLQLNSNLSQ